MKKTKGFSFITFIIFFSSFVSFLAQISYSDNTELYTPPSINAAFADQPIKLDGVFDESAWDSAGKIEQLFHYQTGKTVNDKTSVSILYDKENLYLGIVCQESFIEKTKSLITEENGKVFLDDSIEIFISPFEKAASDNYYHFVTNMNAVKYAEKTFDYDNHPKWECATKKYDDRWTAEIKLPFSSFDYRGQNDAFWRLNIGRNQTTTATTSSWCIVGDTFHSPYKFGILSGIDIDGKFITLKSNIIPEKNTPISSGEAVKQLDKALSLKEEPLLIIPKPRNMTLTNEDFMIDAGTKIILADNPTSAALQAAEEINEELGEYGQYPLNIIYESKISDQDYKNSIIISEAEKSPLINKLIRNMNINKDNPGEEGYALIVNKDYTIIAGSDSPGTYWGIQSLKQLIRRQFPQNQNSSLLFKGVRIFDKPEFRFRGVHILIDKDSATVHKKMIDKLFSRFKLNYLIIEAEQGIAWKSRPEIVAPFAIEPVEVKKLVAYANKKFMKVIPLVQSLGHGEWMFRNGVNKEFAEDASNPNAYCPLNPKSYEFILPIFDEAIEIFNHPEYIHIGHDEHDFFAKFPAHKECIKIGNEELYFMDTKKIYNYLKAKNIKVCMWGDILKRPSFSKRINEIPQDIVIYDWDYSPKNYYPGIDLFKNNRHQVIGSTFNDPLNISKFSIFGKSKNIEGMLQTTWAGYDKNISILEREFSQVMAYITAADCFWNPEDREYAFLEYNAAKVLNNLWYGEGACTKEKHGFSVNLNNYLNISLIPAGNDEGFLYYGKGIDFSGLLKTAKDGDLHLTNGVHYNLSKIENNFGAIMLKGNGITSAFPSETKSIKINALTSNLYFLHTTFYKAQKGSPVGKYVIHYESGEKETIDLVYTQNISGWLDIETYYSGAEYSWLAGKAPAYIDSMHWKNPHPDKKITSIDLISSEQNLSILLLAITGDSE